APRRADPMTPASTGGSVNPERPEFQTLAEWDWVQALHGRSTTLHHLARYDGPIADERYDPCVSGLGAASCGFATEWHIPGLFSRTGARRCPRCCDVFGIKRGRGSPKNDPELRPWVEARLSAEVQREP